MTVGELKERLKNVDDNMLIVSYQNGMEKSGILKAYPYAGVIKVKEVEKSTWDRFDGTDYTYTAYEKDKHGDKEVFCL